MLRSISLTSAIIQTGISLRFVDIAAVSAFFNLQLTIPFNLTVICIGPIISVGKIQKQTLKRDSWSGDTIFVREAPSF